jgi:hypothetical protein
VAKVRLWSGLNHKPSPKQLAFLATPQREALYGGAAGGGKTDALLMAALQYVDIPNYSAILLRRSYTDLALPGAIMSRARAWLQPHKEIRWDRETHTFHWPHGATLAFGYIATSDDVFRYQSAEFQYIGFDEVTEFPFEEDYMFMFSRLRRTKDLERAGVPLRVRAASNPVGAGLPWVRDRFIESKSPDRIFIPATFMDNEHIDREGYLQSLRMLHPSLQQKLIDGDWTASLDMAFPDFNEEIHKVPNMRPPDDWRRWEAMDFGVTNPTAWYAAATDPEGNILVHGEYYQPGLISRTSSAILTLRHNHWGEPLLAVCDPSIQARTGFGATGLGTTQHGEFANNGVFLVPANNDRMAGFGRISELLRPDPVHKFPYWHERRDEYGSPRIFFTEECKNLLKQLRDAPLDAKTMEIVDPFFETRRGHSVAALRYLVTARVGATEQKAPSIVSGRRVGNWNNWNSWQEVR